MINFPLEVAQRDSDPSNFDAIIDRRSQLFAKARHAHFKRACSAADWRLPIVSIDHRSYRDTIASAPAEAPSGSTAEEQEDILRAEGVVKRRGYPHTRPPNTHYRDGQSVLNRSQR